MRAIPSQEIKQLLSSNDRMHKYASEAEQIFVAGDKTISFANECQLKERDVKWIRQGGVFGDFAGIGTVAQYGR